MARTKSEEVSKRTAFKDACKSVIELHKMVKTVQKLGAKDLVEETLNTFEQTYTVIKDQLMAKPAPSPKKLKKAAVAESDD